MEHQKLWIHWRRIRALVVMLLTMLEVHGKIEAVRRVWININNATPLIALSLDKVPAKVLGGGRCDGDFLSFEGQGFTEDFGEFEEG
jgi:hypothetical protein